MRVRKEDRGRDQLPSSERRGHPEQSVAALLRRLRIHPEAQRILGNSSVAVVTLEQLNFQPPQPNVESGGRDKASGLDHQQNGLDSSEWTGRVREEISEEPPSEPTSWTEPQGPDVAPEPDTGSDCVPAINPDPPLILLDVGCDEWDTDGKTDDGEFYLDPDRELSLVIELDPDSETARARTLRRSDGTASGCDAPPLTREAKTEDAVATAEMENEDFCAVCLNGGELLCCDHCPKVYHLDCHVPVLTSYPAGDWVCTLCSDDRGGGGGGGGEGKAAASSLSDRDHRRCEKLTLMLYCNLLSAPFHEPVSPLARNYYQVIRRPVDLSLIRGKLERSAAPRYASAQEFVDDVLLMFKNCATFNYPDSEVAQAGQNLEGFFLSQLREVFPDRTFPSASRDKTDRARLRWLHRGRGEHQRRRRFLFKGKKYYT